MMMMTMLLKMMMTMTITIMTKRRFYNPPHLGLRS